MSFATFKEKSVSEKTILIETDLGRLQGKWFNEIAGIWYYQFYTIRRDISHTFLRGNFTYGSFLRSETADSGLTEIPVKIGSLSANGTYYTEQVSRINCVNTNASWYYDVNLTRIYVHFATYGNPEIYTVVIGHTLGLSNRAIDINSLRYEPKLEGFPAVSKSKDTLYFGLVSYDGGNLSFNNADGFFDTIKDNYLFGQEVEQRYGGDTEAYADYRMIHKGYIENLNLNNESCEMAVIDNRKQLSKKIPTNKFNKTTYTDLKDGNVGKSIPLIWGAVYNVPIICTNEEKAGAGNYDFKIADVTDHASGITDIVQIYVDGVATTWANESLANATFELTTENYTKGNKITGDIQGFKVEITSGATTVPVMLHKGLDVIENILGTYQSIAYTSDNYNTTEWSAFERRQVTGATTKKNVYAIGINVNKEKELIDIIEDIAFSNFATFLIQDDGRYTWRKFSSATTANRTIEKRELLSNPEIEYDGTEFLTSANVGYMKDWKENEYAWYDNILSEASIFNKYLKYQGRDFETVLTTNTDAFKLSESIIDYMDTVPAHFTIETGIQNIDLEIGDTVNFNIDRVDSVWYGDVKVEIVKTQKDLMSNVVTLTGREI